MGQRVGRKTGLSVSVRAVQKIPFKHVCVHVVLPFHFLFVTFHVTISLVSLGLSIVKLMCELYYANRSTIETDSTADYVRLPLAIKNARAVRH